MAGSRTCRCARYALLPSRRASSPAPSSDWSGRSATPSERLAAGKSKRSACQAERRSTTTGYSRSSGSFRLTRWRSATSLRPTIPWCSRTCPRSNGQAAPGSPATSRTRLVVPSIASGWTRRPAGNGPRRCASAPKAAGQATPPPAARFSRRARRTDNMRTLAAVIDASAQRPEPAIRRASHRAPVTDCSSR